ncbi:hypothetical protein DEO72_LG5g1570 [Vigna unguiculata]|uniref:Uncharacterized protein n=1 Tax=Vigna unguiculata TaxID=3917 RepID=A0A4D6LXQ1_VIGUN|nr:hypothetical protein DEO72_LG5g1570 [Vigna unguiculata]
MPFSSSRKRSATTTASHSIPSLLLHLFRPPRRTISTQNYSSAATAIPCRPQLRRAILQKHRNTTTDRAFLAAVLSTLHQPRIHLQTSTTTPSSPEKKPEQPLSAAQPRRRV